MRKRQNRRFVTMSILVGGALLLIIIGQRTAVLRPAVSALMAPLAPLGRLFSAGTDLVAAQPEQPPGYDELLERNRELERLVAGLQVDIVGLRELERDYFRLAGLVDYLTLNPDQDLVTADVIMRDTSSYLRWIIINRGARDGIQVGAPVINELGLVGRVEDIAANTAWIRLAIDPASAVNARLQNARAEGTVIGLLEGGMRMQFIPQEAIVEEGDLALTSGLGGSFPADLVIGQVTSVRSQQAALFQEAEIRPLVDYSKLEIVAVITSFTPIDTTLFEDVIEEESQEDQ